MNLRVAVGRTKPLYAETPPYHPSGDFPELPFRERSSEDNGPYALLRELFRRLALDAENADSAEWNPLGATIRPGNTVVLKPNFVLSYNAGDHDLYAVVTHPSILRALVDYCFVALRGEGRIVIADSPQMNCDMEALLAVQRLDAVQHFYRERFGFDVELIDLRTFAMIHPRQPAYSTNRKPLAGDPLGSVRIDLGRHSHFYGLPSENYYGADYDRAETIRNHSGETHAYEVSRTVLDADVVLSVPKMKVHKKVGVTLNLKGLVGINTNKNCLVHYTLGTPDEHGDQLPSGIPPADRRFTRMQRWLFDHALARQDALGDGVYRAAMGAYRAISRARGGGISEGTRLVDSGNWHGNDSAWRMTADLAKILYFADTGGVLQDSPQRRVFCVVDGIVGGEGEGPLSPTPKRAGCLVAGANPFAVDLVTTRLMGFDPTRIRKFQILDDERWDFGLRNARGIRVSMPDGELEGTEFFGSTSLPVDLHFEAHPGWRGAIEIQSRLDAGATEDHMQSARNTHADAAPPRALP